MSLRQKLASIVTALVTASLIAPAYADTWPQRPVTIVVPFAAGGNTDGIARMIGQRLTEALGQPFIIENKGGAGGALAGEIVARAQPDGYTMFVTAVSVLTIVPKMAKVKYDPAKDFAPISNIATNPFVLVVNNNMPVKTVAEFVQWGKANPKGFTFGSPGAGSAPHLTAELLMRAAGGKGIVVQFKGDAPAYTELLAGRIDATLTAISTAVPHVKAGKLRVLAVANEQRTPLHPQTPTFVESGFPSVVGYGWYGLMAPAGAPDAIVQRLNKETNAAVADAEVRRKAEAAGLQLRGGTTADFRAFLDNEAKKWSQVIKAANIHV